MIKKTKEKLTIKIYRLLDNIIFPFLIIFGLIVAFFLVFGAIIFIGYDDVFHVFINVFINVFLLWGFIAIGCLIFSYILFSINGGKI